MHAVTRIAVVDDHPLYRAGIRQAVDAAFDMQVVAEGADAMDALHIAATSGSDMILLDLNIPGGGIDAARSICQDFPDTKIVILTNSESEANVATAMQLGAYGYIVKGIGGTELVSILRMVNGGESYVTPSLAAEVLRGMGRASHAEAAL